MRERSLARRGSSSSAADRLTRNRGWQVVVVVETFWQREGDFSWNGLLMLLRVFNRLSAVGFNIRELITARLVAERDWQHTRPNTTASVGVATSHALCLSDNVLTSEGGALLRETALCDAPVYVRPSCLPIIQEQNKRLQQILKR